MVCGVTNWRPSFCARQCGKGVKWRWFLTPETFPQGPSVALRQSRPQATQARLNEAAQLYINAVRSGRQQEYDPEALGFEFTIEQIELCALDLQPDLFHDWAVEQQNQ